jgi:TPR repeat protein
MICTGCAGGNEALVKKQNEKNPGKKVAFTTCPFCRELPPFSGETVRRLEARALKDDHVALRNLGNACMEGDLGLPKDDLKALDCLIKAVELGSPEACTNIGTCYDEGNGVVIDKERAALFKRVGALRGSVIARHNVGVSEYNNLGNIEIGIRHWKIAAEAGNQGSLNALKAIYNADGKMKGKEFITKEYLDFAYRACHGAQMEVKSEEREKHRRDVANVDMKC